MTAAPTVPRIPEWIAVYPEIAHAALKRNMDPLVAAWCLLHACDRDGRGWFERPVARRLVEVGRGVGARQARRILDAGSPGFWHLGSTDRLWLISVPKVAAALGVERVSAPRLVPLADLQKGPASLRATLFATVYRPDAEGRPLSRRLVRELTGIPESTQRRYENQYGHAERVTPVHVELSHITDPQQRRRYAERQGDWGAYLGEHGDLMRRHPDIRRAARQRAGSRTAATRVNRQLTDPARSGSPATKARGERPLRAFFPASASRRRNAAKAWMRAKRALGKGRPDPALFDPALDYAVIESRDVRGHRRFESAVQPLDLQGGHPSSGSIQALEDLPLRKATSPDRSTGSGDQEHANHSRSNDVRPERPPENGDDEQHD